MKKIYFLFYVMLFVFSGFAQDYIVYDSGEKVFVNQRETTLKSTNLTQSAKSVAAIDCNNLITTSFATNNGFAGNMFDVVVKNSISIKSFEINISFLNAADFAIYYKLGTHVGFHDSPSEWTLIENITGVISNGVNVPTHLPLTNGISIPGGQTVAFYILCTNYDNANGHLNYINGTAVGNVFVEDDNLQILEGYGSNSFLFDAGFFSPRVWSGSICYDIGLNPIEVVLYENGEYILTDDDIETIVEGTDFEGLDITVSPKAFECVHVGERIPVKVTATDGQENVIIAWTTVTVYDETPPVALCKDLELVLDENGKARIIPSKVNAGDGTVVTPGWARTYNDLASGSYDACGISILNIDQYNFDCSDVGENTVTLTVVDAHGNTSTCESTVTVSDNIVPVIEPVDNVELVLEPGNCDSEIEYPTLVVNDNCETTLELTEGLGPDGVFPVGTTTETWLATDDAGNTVSVSFDITIVATNALPTIDEQTDITVTEDTYSVEVTLTGISEGNDCEEQDITVTATGDNAELITSVMVDYTTGDSTGTVIMKVAPEMAGEAKIIVTVEDEEGGTISDTFMVTVTAVNDAPFVVAPIADQTIHASYVLKVPVSPVLGDIFDDIDYDVLTIEVMSEGTDSLPTWATMMGDTLVCTPTIADTGCVNLVITATDAGGLSVSDTFAVCVDGYPVSIGDLGMNKFEVQMYPNPTRGKVNMDITSGIYDVELSVMDITGKVVLQKQYSASENITFDMSGKVSGMYFVKMNIDGNQMVKKLIVDRK